LTIKSISNTKCSMSFLRSLPLSPFSAGLAPNKVEPYGSCITCSSNARQIFNCQRSDFFGTASKTSKISF